MEREPDHVGRIMAQWRTERPDLDVSPQGVIGRLHRIGARLTEELVAEYSRFGLSEGDFDVLATLRRSAPPYELTPESSSPARWSPRAPSASGSTGWSSKDWPPDGSATTTPGAGSSD